MLQVSRYHPLLVALHWLVGLLVAAALYFGAMHLVQIPNSSPMKIDKLRIHMTVGMLTLPLVFVRLWVRRVTTHPAKATSGGHFLTAVATISHGLLYISLILMSLIGLTLAFQAGLFGIVFAHRGSLPPDFWVYSARTGHYVFSRLLMFLIALHVCGALYHTFVLKDGFVRRMWFVGPFEARTQRKTQSIQRTTQS